jgi:hypothetical protein
MRLVSAGGGRTLRDNPAGVKGWERMGSTIEPEHFPKAFRKPECGLAESGKG